MHTHSVDHAGKLVNVSEDERSPRLHIMQTHTRTDARVPSQAAVRCFRLERSARWSYREILEREGETRGELTKQPQVKTLSFFSAQTYLLFIRVIYCDSTKLVNVN